MTIKEKTALLLQHLAKIEPYMFTMRHQNNRIVLHDIHDQVDVSPQLKPKQFYFWLMGFIQGFNWKGILNNDNR